jgi:uncharacterized protein (TIGR00369 family)
MNESGHPDGLGPFAAFLDYCKLKREIIEDGVARVIVDIEPCLTNLSGAAHGGLLMTMLDCAMAGAARSLLDADVGIMTVDMQVAFLAPGHGRLTGEGRVTRNGRSLIFCEGDIRDEAGVLLVKGTGLFRPRLANG